MSSSSISHIMVSYTLLVLLSLLHSLGRLFRGANGRVDERNAQLGHKLVFLLALRVDVDSVGREDGLKVLETGKGDLADDIVIQLLDDSVGNLRGNLNVLTFARDFCP